MTNQRITATNDPSLSATVLRRTPLHYAAGPDAALDRPGHIRAASAIVAAGGRLAVVQDDANFVALIDASGAALALTLPAGEGGLRLFDDLRGNKRYKLDLEAACMAPGDSGPLLLAFGSGSSPLRERLMVAEGLDSGDPSVRLVPAPELYAALRGAESFAGSELNLEGAVFLGGAIRLFNRGNGAPRGGRRPVDATCDLAWPALLAYLRALAAAPSPAPEAIVQYDLGAIGGMRLTFTDAALWPGGALRYAAAAEDSPDAVRDGPVAGSAIGAIAGGAARYAPLRTPDGAIFPGKVEGLTPDPADLRRALVVVDRDDPAAPSELCEVLLEGPW